MARLVGLRSTIGVTIDLNRRGAIGTAVAQQNLRSVLGLSQLARMNAPEAYTQFTPRIDHR
jgi:hypothetical protein